MLVISEAPWPFVLNIVITFCSPQSSVACILNFLWSLLFCVCLHECLWECVFVCIWVCVCVSVVSFGIPDILDSLSHALSPLSFFEIVSHYAALAILELIG